MNWLRVLLISIGVLFALWLADGAHGRDHLRFAIPERTTNDDLVCAVYGDPSSPRHTVESCKPAAMVRAYLLRNAEPAECEP